MNTPLDFRFLLKMATYSIGLWLIVWLVVWFILSLLGIVLFFEQPIVRIDDVLGMRNPSRMGFNIGNAMTWSWWQACIVALSISQITLLAAVIAKKR